jgi:hypothetical protein
MSMSDIPTLRDAGESPVLLRESMHTRAVTFVANKVAVCDCRDGDPANPTRAIAWIDDMGSARDLLNKAYDADVARDLSAWAALPLRYGPYCSTWVLSAPAPADIRRLNHAKLATDFGRLALPRLPFQVEACAVGAEHVTIDSSIE